ncbi:MAG: type II secretion system GspH family protein [Halanaerobiales bacterium]|nr:type II secretion system GspH family protein [Halanaerobiales bacterium]
MKNSDYKSGFTLLEVLVSVALLGIVATTIVPAIGGSVVNIINIGVRDQAVNTTANFTEIVQQNIIISGNELSEEEWQNMENEAVYFKGSKVNLEYSDCSTVENNPDETKIKFCKEKTSGGYKIKVVFFYHNGDKKVLLNSFATYKRG